MVPFADLIQQGAAKAWLFVPSAVLLGALHGLEPGHSKTMMAAFIVAIRGTVAQAVLLGLAATVSHTAVVWAVALGGLYIGRTLDAEVSEPYFQLASAAAIVAIALWMLWRTWRDRRAAHAHHHHHHHDHDHDHHRHHHDEEPEDAHQLEHAAQIRRSFAGGTATTGQIVVFGLTGGLIPCPAAITVLLICLQLKHLTLGVALVLCFSVGLALTMVATGAIAALVLCFSIGLALTLVGVGVAASLSMRHASQRWSWLGTFARRAPYASSALVLAVGLYVGIQGWLHLA